MAKSKKRKHPKQASSFYETLPIGITPLIPVVQLHEELSQHTPRLKKSWTTFIQYLLTFPWKTRARSLARQAQVLTSRAGLTVTNYLIAAAHAVALHTQLIMHAFIEYTPPAIIDLRQILGKFLRIVTGFKARLLYAILCLIAISGVSYLGVTTAITTLNTYANDISSPAALLAKKKTGTTILDRNGQVLFEGYGAQTVKLVTLADIPQTLKEATLAAEDPAFYDHPGFSWRGTARAAWVDITRGSKAEGGSTLTQQLIKNALLTSDKKFQRKYQELLLSIALERRYSKDQIFEMYLNETYYGQGASGVEAASQTYFHKSARDLTLGESALIAGLPLGPSRFDPNNDPIAATGRRDYVLSRMLELGKITKDQADTAKAQPLQLAKAGAPNSVPAESNPMMIYARTVNIRAPHFVFYVLNQLRTQYGDDLIEQGGITVRTTLDLAKQQIAEQTVRERITALSEHHVTNGGLVSMTPSNGDILAMVGSVDYNAPGFGNVNVILSQLQPGSSFKPIAYVTAFKKGYTGATHVDDTPLILPNGDGTLYIPQNYDGKFRGSVSLRRALGNSLNIPAIKVLQHAGIHDTIQMAHDLGITSLTDESRYGLALVLGGGEVRPLDMATVYATFANNGTKTPPRSILQITDRHGSDITKSSTAKPTPVLDSRYAYMITSILSDNNARTEEFGPNSPLKLSRPAAAKTGTTNDFRDNWTVGYTPQLVTAVWVGNNDHSPMNNVDGITGAAPIWHDYMEKALADQPVIAFTPPPGITLAKICADGGLANAWDLGYEEAFLSEAVPTKRCSSFPTTPSPSPTTDNPNTTPFPTDQPEPQTTPATTTQHGNPFRIYRF